MSAVSLSGSSILQGEFTPPGDKSISHRAIMFGALSEGTSIYSNFLEGEDCVHTLEAFRALGVAIDYQKGSGCVTIHGVGLSGLKKPSREIYLGNSGTSIRLLLGILAGQSFETSLAGDPSLSSRPMRRVTDPLKKMGAQINGKDKGNFAPLTIQGCPLQAIEYENHLGSAQVKSAVLFAGLYAKGKTRILEKILSRDHTERFLKASGARFQKNGDWLEIEKTDQLRPFEAKIPGDMSAAAFFIVGAAMTPGSELIVNQVCLNATRTGVLDVLQRMGASIDVIVEQEAPEPLGSVRVRGRRLKGATIEKAEMPSLIDELPILMTAMALAEGESLISGAEELRVKETDRIHSMVTSLSAVGAKIEERPDGCKIEGVEALKGATVQSFKDHRTAMSLAIANLLMKGDVVIEDTDCVATSFPTFFQAFERLRG